MGVEIERKFLVDLRKWRPRGPGEEICQGYISTEPDRTVRIRLADNQAFVTFKSAKQGISRSEFEYEVPRDDAVEMVQVLCEKPPIRKRRYEEQVGRHVWQVDVFEGENVGLVVAEIELTREDEMFQRPNWLLTEVTSDERYSNSNLVNHPYRHWVSKTK